MARSKNIQYYKLRGDMQLIQDFDNGKYWIQLYFPDSKKKDFYLYKQITFLQYRELLKTVYH